MEHDSETAAALLGRIELYLSRSGTAASRFGRDALDDPAFVQTLRQGRVPRASTVRRISLYLDALKSRPRNRG